MSFSFEFVATKADAEVIVMQEHAPSVVKAFLVEALAAFKADELVHVRAFGHLYNNDHTWSNADIKVIPLTLRVPKPFEVKS